MWQYAFMNESSPPTLDGTIQVRNSNGGGLVHASLNGVQLRTQEQIIAWQAFEVAIKGGLEPVDVPLLLCAQKPNPVSSGNLSIKAVGDVAARAVSMRIELENADEVPAGIHFSDYSALYGWRLYFIGTVATVISHPTWRDITFGPPLRFAIADGHELEFEEPRCVMRLATSDAMAMELEYRKRGNPSASFIEAF